MLQYLFSRMEESSFPLQYIGERLPRLRNFRAKRIDAPALAVVALGIVEGTVDLARRRRQCQSHTVLRSFHLLTEVPEVFAHCHKTKYFRTYTMHHSSSIRLTTVAYVSCLVPPLDSRGEAQDVKNSSVYSALDYLLDRDRSSSSSTSSFLQISSMASSWSIWFRSPAS